MNIVYFDCFAGIAGDMTVAAFLDLGVPLDFIRDELARLSLPTAEYRLAAERVMRRGVSAMHFDVHVEGHQPHRHYTDIAAMIEASSLAPTVKERAQRIFFRLAEAEAKVHGVAMDHVHFHEVGGVDSIVDIVATSLCLDYLGITQLYASPLPWGSGFVETAHGRLPVPAPATAELLRGMPVHGETGPGERVTPTGAAILAALASGFGPAPAMRVTGIGCGAGTKDFGDMPNIVRLVMGEKSTPLGRDEVTVLETHIDDMNPEILGHLMERLLAAGALDVAFSPLQMKKNRPGTRLTVVAPPTRAEELAALVLTESTAIGVRSYQTARFVLDRRIEERDTSLGAVKVKVIGRAGEILRIVPEYEECRRLAEEKGLPLAEVYRRLERDITPS
ncbi:MAG TPA: nickel pincer cofactor biosynthesis protein LarC [Geobacteraceae bacterium]